MWILARDIEDHALPGDANLDGRVDVPDAILFCFAWKSKIRGPNSDPDCDFNKDEK